MGWPAVQSYANGSPLSEATFNKPINQLAERTEHLRRMLSERDSSKVSVEAETIGDVFVGCAVYRNEIGIYAPAEAGAEQNRWFYAADKAMAVGVVSRIISDTSAVVVLYGQVHFNEQLMADAVISDPEPVSGRHYLSTVTGKLTSSPVGPVVYVCDCQISEGRIVSMLVNPQYRDTGESHIHRAFVLSGSPMGYAVRGANSYSASRIRPVGHVPNTTAESGGLSVELLGGWYTDEQVEYSLAITLRPGASAGSGAWGDYNFSWESIGGVDGAGSEPMIPGDFADFSVGTHGLKVRLHYGPILPSEVTGDSFSIRMPDSARAWTNCPGGGFRLNLGMYPEMARFIPALPSNGAEITVDGVELRGPEFGERAQWSVGSPDDQGGPWLVWHGGEYTGSVGVTTPFVWDSDVAEQRSRDIVMHVNRMRVGPTGFVTSLEPAKGAPLRITSAHTGAPSMQGALQIAFDVDFTTDGKGVPGCNVIKRITGTKFETGPVVEKIIAGPGLSVDNSQGVVTVSATNSVYSGDFETIALRNAKQDVVGGVFPYTKLLGWRSVGTNIASGFTAKFRVPDGIPYGDYNVVVSASVFGEGGGDIHVSRTASFMLQGFHLPDYSVSMMSEAGERLQDADSPLSQPSAGLKSQVSVRFKPGYTAFDPVLVHGFDGDVPAGAYISHAPALLLRQGSGAPIAVRPGYFVAVGIDRCASGGTPYEAALGFMSLRWNLVKVG